MNIVRLIYKRLQYSNEHQQYRRTVKAALILVPLFGTQFFLSPLVMCESSVGAEYVNIFNQLIESSQVRHFLFLNKKLIFTLVGLTSDVTLSLFENKAEIDNFYFSDKTNI